MMASPLKQRTRILVMLAIVVLLVKGCAEVYGYAIVIDQPAAASLAQSGEVHVERVKINGKTIATDDWQWKIELAEPMSWLQGVKRVAIAPETQKSPWLAIKMCSKVAESQEDMTPLETKDLIIGMTVEMKDKYFESAWSESSLRCAEISGMPVVGRLPTGTLHIEKLSQSTKRLVLHGELLDVRATLCHTDTCDSSNPEESLLLEIDNLSFSIDSPVIYEWSNKAGKTWRL